MRFDSARVINTAAELAQIQEANTNALVSMVAYLAQHFASAGWSVQQSEVALAAPPATPRPAVRSRDLQAPGVIARYPEAPSAPGRVIFLTTLGAFDAHGASTVSCAGAAVLLEMARSWPGSRLKRIEPVFVATAERRPGVNHVLDLIGISSESESAMPVLLIMILAPGVGPRLAILGHPSSMHRRAMQAAESLWMPVEPLRWRLRRRLGFPWPIPAPAWDQIVLAGAARGEEEHDRLDSAALAQAAQLATEIALRWGREADATH